ncbi:MAG: hypothetical protein OXK76_02940 [Gammaproteobacteria bacterium]|nr:hypothetical protein [Gammaproteobacteria bacterium]
MSPLVWLVIGIVLVAAIGPVFWLLPSKRDRAQGEMRAAARQAGLVVELATVPKVDARPEERVSAGGKARDAKEDCAAYRLALPRRLEYAPRWLLVKSDRENRYLDGWTTPSPPRRLPARQEPYWRAVGAIIDHLPGGCRAVESDVRHVTWYGRERLRESSPEAVVAGIRDGLVAIGELHEKLDGGDRDAPK